MKTIKLQHPSFFRIQDEMTQNIYYGCDQEWYSSRWKRLSGCGPTTFSNMIYYLNRTRLPEEASLPPLTRSQCCNLMEDVWKYVTPTIHGIPTTQILCNGIRAYAEAKQIRLEIRTMDVPKERNRRPDFSSLLIFLEEALQNDLPVAFLNLDHGEEELLDSWHWVTGISLECGEDGSAALEILDEGKVKKIDLALWYNTSSLGGGFVRVDLLT